MWLKKMVESLEFFLGSIQVSSVKDPTRPRKHEFSLVFERPVPKEALKPLIAMMKQWAVVNATEPRSIKVRKDMRGVTCVFFFKESNSQARDLSPYSDEDRKMAMWREELRKAVERKKEAKG